MLITCPSCHASYTVANNAIGANGRQVRCAKCKEIWHVALPPPAMAAPAAEEWQPSVDEWQPPADEWQPAVDHEPVAPANEAPWPSQDQDALADPPQIEDAPPVVPAQAAVAAVESTSIRPGSADYVQARRRKAARQKAQKEHGFGFTAGRIAAVLAGAVAALFFARESIVRHFPQTASLYARLGLHTNVRGLDFSGLKTSYETQDGMRVLIVEGEIHNISSTVRPVASIRYALRNAAGVEVYGWTGVPDRNLVAPGETVSFRTRLATPPNDGRDVRVSFVTPGTEPQTATVPQKH